MSAKLEALTNVSASPDTADAIVKRMWTIVMDIFVKMEAVASMELVNIHVTVPTGIADVIVWWI